MYSVSFSLCDYRIFRIGLNLNIDRWSIISNKIWSSYYTSSASRTCNPVPPTVIPEGPNYKEKSREIRNLLWPVVIFPVCSVIFVFWSGPILDKFLMSVDTVLKSGVYHLLPADYALIKVRIEFWASEFLLVYILTLYVMLTTCVLSTVQTRQQFSLPFFLFYS